MPHNQDSLTPTPTHKQQAQLDFARFATEMHVKASTELTAVHEKTSDTITSLGNTLASLEAKNSQRVISHYEHGVEILHNVLTADDDESVTPTQRQQAQLDFARFATEMHVKASTDLTAVHEKTSDSVTSLRKTLTTLGKTMTQTLMEHFDKGVAILHDALIVRDDET
jgi:hypothetical protein